MKIALKPKNDDQTPKLTTMWPKIENLQFKFVKKLDQILRKIEW